MPKPVWRRLVVPCLASLEDLADALLVAFDWHRSHLSAFWIERPWRGDAYAPRLQVEMLDGGDDQPADTVTACEFLKQAGDTIFWIYDFGDDWTHRIKVEALVADTEARVVCLAGTNAAPPEDCGGAAGFDHLLRVLSDPTHAEHAEMLEWLGGPFDAAKFDATETDRALAVVPVRGARQP